MPRPLSLDSTEVTNVVSPVAAPGLTVQPLHLVAQATPAPTLVNGRPT